MQTRQLQAGIMRRVLQRRCGVFVRGWLHKILRREIITNKKILNDYIDACKCVEEAGKELKKLKKKRKIVHDKVKGSNPDWPYEARSFSIGGTIETVDDVGLIQREEQILQRKMETAEEMKLQVEEWMQEIPFRMQRIIKYRFFDRLSWEEVAKLMGKKCTGEGIRMEFNRFMKDY